MNTVISSNVKVHFRAPGSAVSGSIHYAFGACSQGALLVARSSEGICAIFIGDDAPALHQQLVEAFPESSLVEATLALQADIEQVVRFIDEPKFDVQLSVSVGGTEFQQRIWSALLEIDAGRTCSYAEVAELVGTPGAVRAVASACAANLLAVAIPCHRVVRSDGSLSGYRWGTDRKRSLLLRERQQ